MTLPTPIARAPSFRCLSPEFFLQSLCEPFGPLNSTLNPKPLAHDSDGPGAVEWTRSPMREDDDGGDAEDEGRRREQ